MAIIAIVLAAHLALHYATYIPALRALIGNLPYFRLHVLHEAEFTLIMFYAAIVFRLRGGLTAVAITAVSSIPFLFTPAIFGREPRPDETRDLVIQVVFILVMGAAITLLYEAVARERERRLALASQLEVSNLQLEALNRTVQASLNQLFVDIRRAVQDARTGLDVTSLEASRERFPRFLRRMEDIIYRG